MDAKSTIIGAAIAIISALLTGVFGFIVSIYQEKKKRDYLFFEFVSKKQMEFLEELDIKTDEVVNDYLEFCKLIIEDRRTGKKCIDSQTCQSYVELVYQLLKKLDGVSDVFLKYYTYLGDSFTKMQLEFCELEDEMFSDFQKNAINIVFRDSEYIEKFQVDFLRGLDIIKMYKKEKMNTVL